MKKTISVLIAGVSLIAVGLIILMVCIISNGGQFMADKDMELTDTQTVSLENIDTLKIKYYSDDIVFYTGENEELVIKEYKNYTPSNDQKTKITKDNNEVTVKGSKWKFALGAIWNRKSRVDVYLPAGYSGILSVSTSSGDISSEISFALSEASVSCSSGDIVLNQITAADIKLSCSSGDINLKSAAGQLSASATSGDISITELSGSGNLDSSSGDINISKINGNGSFSTSSGDISLGVSELTGNLSVDASSGDIALKLPQTSAFSFEANVTSGDIETFFDDKLDYNDRRNHASGIYGDNAQFSITAEASSGDISIDKY